jgi:hypothetical protein
VHLLLGQRPLPAGVGVDQDKRHDERGIVAVELLGDSATPGDPGDVRGAERKRLDQRRKAVRVIRQPEFHRQIGGAASPRLIPGDDGELTGQCGQLRLPHAAVFGGAVDEHQRRPLADALVGDVEPVRTEDLHCRNLSGYQERSTRLPTRLHAELQQVRFATLLRSPGASTSWKAAGAAAIASVCARPRQVPGGR